MEALVPREGIIRNHRHDGPPESMSPFRAFARIACVNAAIFSSVTLQIGHSYQKYTLPEPDEETLTPKEVLFRIIN